jgi:hypothetical protein
MENFIVRIYRRQTDDPDCVTGVVEKPGHNESMRFSSIEELIELIAPQKSRTGDSERKQVIEQRKYRRFGVKDGTLIFDSSTDVGEIIDISMGGLSFACPDIPEESSEPFEVGILCGEDEYCTDKISCRKLMCHGTAGDYPFNSSHGKRKRYSVEFGDLTPKQRLQLEHIIQSYAYSEV